MSSDLPELDDPRCPGCGQLLHCECPTLAEEFVPVYEAIMRSKTASLPTAGATMDCGCVITAKLEQLERCGIDFGTTIASAQMMKPCTQHGGKTLCELGHTQDSCPNWLEALCVCTHPACDRS